MFEHRMLKTCSSRQLLTGGAAQDRGVLSFTACVRDTSDEFGFVPANLEPELSALFL
jgi:hypothetical protein